MTKDYFKTMVILNWRKLTKDKLDSTVVEFEFFESIK